MKLTTAERDRIIAAVEALDFGRVYVHVNAEANRLEIVTEPGPRKERVRDGLTKAT